MRRLNLLTLCSLLLACAIFAFKKRSPTTIPKPADAIIPAAWLKNDSSETPVADRRPPDQTFLTYPEWFLVFSPAEQAAYFRHHTATSFPFTAHTKQIWESYAAVRQEIDGHFPPNPGYHFMIRVIGSSATVEYAIKSVYEQFIGRLTDTHETKTAEDSFNARYTQDYVDFINDEPWYAFDFQKEFKRLWKDLPVRGEHPVRKWERRYILSTELLAKIFYGKLIGLGTRSVYDVALPTTTVVLDSCSLCPPLAGHTTKLPGDALLTSLPRYNKFKDSSLRLAEQGYSFREVAGNSTAILTTVIVPANADFHVPGSIVIFTQPVASDPSQKRIAFVVPVSRLSEELLYVRSKGLTPEHLFDY